MPGELAFEVGGVVSRSVVALGVAGAAWTLAAWSVAIV